VKESDKQLGMVLVADDNQDVLSAIEENLELYGYQVMTVATGLDALRVLRSEPCDVLLTDIIMPGIGGLGLIEICHKEFPDLPIIAMTGYAEQVRDLVLERSPHYYLEKPFEPIQLLEVLESVLVKGQGKYVPDNI
jgi:CheY-like chemotaxis protein